MRLQVSYSIHLTEIFVNNLCWFPGCSAGKRIKISSSCWWHFITATYPIISEVVACNGCRIWHFNSEPLIHSEAPMGTAHLFEVIHIHRKHVLLRQQTPDGAELLLWITGVFGTRSTPTNQHFSFLLLIPSPCLHIQIPPTGYADLIWHCTT